jgi:tetratricopeptide (TPR) repeat protein
VSWSLESRAADPADDHERTVIGLRLVQALVPFWSQHGHLTEGRRSLERAIELASDDAGAPLAKVARGLGDLLQRQGEHDAALPLFERSLAIWRGLGDREQEARTLNNLGVTHYLLGDPDTARSFLEDSIAIARQIGGVPLRIALTNLGQAETDAGNFDRATQVLQESLALDQKDDDITGIAINQQSLAQVSLRAGRAGEARDQLAATFDYAISCGDPALLAGTLELSACIAADLGEGMRAARLAGAADSIRRQAGATAQQPEAVLLERFLAPARATVAGELWDAELAAGRALTQQQAAALLVAPVPST